jgi:putative oxidoreductase
MVHNHRGKLADIENLGHTYMEYLRLPFPIFLSYIAT